MEMFVKYTVMVSVILLMLGVGMGTSFRQVVDAVRQFGVVLRGVLANFLVTPVLIYLVLLSLPLPSDVKIGIMLMAAAPVAPMASPFVEVARGDVAYGVGLMVVVAILSVVLTPLILGLALPKERSRGPGGPHANRSDTGDRAADTDRYRHDHSPAKPGLGRKTTQICSQDRSDRPGYRCGPAAGITVRTHPVDQPGDLPRACSAGCGLTFHRPMDVGW